MAGFFTDRLSWKELFHSLEVELQQQYGLSPVGARALCRRIGDFIDSYLSTNDRKIHQIVYSAVVVGEKAGKPLKFCTTIPVNLSLFHSLDAEVLSNSGTVALRQARIERIAREAFAQGALLSHEDLSVLLAIDISTVKRLVKACEIQTQRPPTRGFIDDIGRTVSHKELVIDLYFQGLLPGEIAARTGHSLGSVERYLNDFARVASLLCQEMKLDAVTRITELSSKQVKVYSDLFKKFASNTNQPVLERLMRRYGPVNPTKIKEVNNGKTRT